MSKKRVAIVVQRYGIEVNGGAELHARWLAERLAPEHDVEVATSCAVDYTTWKTIYPPGKTAVNDIPVHRFPVDAPRDWPRAQKETFQLLNSDHTLADEEAWLRKQGPYSTPLLDWIKAAEPNFDFFIFFTYLYGQTCYGLPLVAQKAILVPTAHDDDYLAMPVFRPIFNLPRAIVYNTVTEKEMVEQVTGNSAVPNIVAGIGINEPASADPARFRKKFGIAEDFIFYLGRIDRSKNVPELLTFFQRYIAETGRPIKLVLGGKSHIDIPQHPQIIQAGFLDETDKFDALAATQLLIMPSKYESLSMVMLEAWLTGRPVLANGQCAVLKAQCRNSNGGLYYSSYEEFKLTLDRLLDDAPLRDALGANGRAFTRQTYSWEIILAKYNALFEVL